jgi:hypothetical protein
MSKTQQRHAIAVGNWREDGWRANARSSIAAVARRWGVPVVELTKCVGNDDCGVLEKLWLEKHCEGFDRVVWFDRDVVVRSDCPNLFDVVPAGRFGCVSSHQAPWHVRESARALAPLFAANGATYDYTIDHLNTGVMVFDPPQHAGIFRAARGVSVAAGELPFFDEPQLSLAVKQSGRRHLLERAFNRCGLANLHEFSPAMTDYIWHFCGIKSQPVEAQIDATIWQLPAQPVWQRPIIGTVTRPR